MGHFSERVKVTWDATCKWVGEHKVEVVIGGLGLVLLFIEGMWVVKNGRPIKMPAKQALLKEAADTASTLTPIVTKPINVTNVEVRELARSGFVRKLPKGWHASAAKMAEAAKKGIELLPGETLVDPCIVTLKAV